MFLNITSTTGSVRRGVKKWMTRKEISDKLGEAVAEYVCTHKLNDPKLLETEVRDHPDAPGCEALRSKFIHARDHCLCTYVCTCVCVCAHT